MFHSEVFKSHFVPAKKGGFGDKPVIVILHGRGDSYRPFLIFKDELKLDWHYLLLNAPRRYERGYTWYGFPPRQEYGVLSARNKLSLLLDELNEAGIKDGKIYFLGFSQGCLVACDFLMHSGRRLGGIVGISGYLYFFPRWQKKLSEQSRKTPALITHGTRDFDLPIEQTRSQVNKLIQQKLTLKWLEFDKKHEIDEARELPAIRQWLVSTQKSRSKTSLNNSKTFK